MHNAHPKLLRELVKSAMAKLEQMSEKRGSLLGLPTGFQDLDRITSGLQAGNMIVIVGRPSMGKTALALNIAENVAVQCRKPVGVFSLDMSADAWATRLLCSMTKVNLWSLHDTALSEQEHHRLTESANTLAQVPLLIDDTASLRIDQLCGRARQMQSRFDIQLFVVDYLQLIRSRSRRADVNRQTDIAEISLELKSLAKELSVPVIVLSQLPPHPEHDDQCPKLSDSCKSCSIVQDADVVGLLVRPEVYADNEEERSAVKGEATLIIAKQRNGPTGDVPLVFLSEYARFENPECMPQTL